MPQAFPSAGSVRIGHARNTCKDPAFLLSERLPLQIIMQQTLEALRIKPPGSPTEHERSYHNGSEYNRSQG